MRGRQRKCKRKPPSLSSSSSHSQDKLYLPPEILTEVLTRLPVKTLVRFRCVCKSWLSLIDNPYFISTHLRIFNKNPNQKLQTLTLSHDHVCSVGKELTLRTYRMADCTFRKSGDIFAFPKKFMFWAVRGYVNGLILTRWSFEGSGGGKGDLMLVNPSIRKCLILPPCPFNSPIAIIFGIDLSSTSSNDYKVVVFDEDKSQGAAIYELNKGCWRTTKSINYMQGVSLDAYYTRGVFCKGSVHWIPRNNEPILLVSFDFGSETLSHKELLIGFDRGMSQHVPFILGESVAIFEHVYGEGCCIWMMRGDDDEWTKCYSGVLELKLDIYDLFYYEQMDMFFICGVSGVNYFHIKDNQIHEMRRPRRAYVRFMDTFVESLMFASGSEGQAVRPLSDLLNDS